MSALPPPYEPSPEDEADLVALADGRLDPDRVAALDARLASEPDLAAALQRQSVGLSAIQGAVADIGAPLRLRAHVEREEAAARSPRPRRRRFALPMSLPRLGFAGLGVAAATVAVVLVALAGGGPGVQDAVAFAGRSATAAPVPDPATPQLLRQQVQGVPFPNYLARFGWKPDGTRTDELDGRATRTVFYAKGGRRIAYTIVSGEALENPDDAKPSVLEGVRLRAFEADGRSAVTWLRGGHTCVLSGDGVPTRELLELAAWKGKGAVPF